MAQISDWAEALRSTSFWRGYYSLEDTNPADAIFPVDPKFDDHALWGDVPEKVAEGLEGDALEAAFDAAINSGSRLYLPFPGGITWEIQFSSSPAIYHMVLHDDYDPVVMGSDDPHAALPILRQPELVALDRLGATRWWRDRAPIPGAFLVPLFQPTCWLTDADEPDPARELFIDAWVRTGMLDANAAAMIAGRVVQRAPLPAWAPDWRYDGPDYGWVSDGRHTRRGPEMPASAAAHHLFKAIDEVLAADGA